MKKQGPLCEMWEPDTPLELQTGCRHDSCWQIATRFRTAPSGFWMPNGGFWQLMPLEQFMYEPPELSREEQIEATLRYLKGWYGGRED